MPSGATGSLSFILPSSTMWGTYIKRWGDPTANIPCTFEQIWPLRYKSIKRSHIYLHQLYGHDFIVTYFAKAIIHLFRTIVKITQVTWVCLVSSIAFLQMCAWVEEGQATWLMPPLMARVAPDRSSANNHELPCVLSIKKSLRHRSKNGDSFRENTRSAKKEEKGGLPLFLISVPGFSSSIDPAVNG